MQPLESSLEALTIRVAKLEAQNRRLKKAGIALLILATATVAMGQASAKKVIEANEFVLKDVSGKVRARLSVEGTDRPTLSFYNEKTGINAAIAGGDEPFVTLQSLANTGQVQLGANRGFVGLAIYEKEIRAGLSVQKGTSALDLFDKNGKPVASLNADSALGPGLTMTDTNSKAFLSMGVSPSDVGPNFSMSDPAGNPGAVLLTSQGKPSLTLNDKEGFSAVFGSADIGMPTTGLKASTSVASVMLFGKDKKVLWSAPR